MPPADLEIFIGQVVALLPRISAEWLRDPVALSRVSSLFPRAIGGIAVHERTPKPRSYSLYLTTENKGVLTAGGVEIPVTVSTLTEDTPREATAFVVTAIAGPSLWVRGVAEGVATR